MDTATVIALIALVFTIAQFVAYLLQLYLKHRAKIRDKEREVEELGRQGRGRLENAIQQGVDGKDEIDALKRRVFVREHDLGQACKGLNELKSQDEEAFKQFRRRPALFKPRTMSELEAAEDAIKRRDETRVQLETQIARARRGVSTALCESGCFTDRVSKLFGADFSGGVRPDETQDVDAMTAHETTSKSA
jgi:hypothetical protein